MNKTGRKRCFIVDIQHNCPTHSVLELPEPSLLERWVCAVFEHENLLEAELTLRLVDESEMQALNYRYRGKDKPTNVLSFPSHLPKEIMLETPLLGDIIVCVPVIEREAAEQEKPLFAHWAHMVIHGALHVLGYDHMTDEEASIMEEKEIIILKTLDIENPYEEEMK